MKPLLSVRNLTKTYKVRKGILKHENINALKNITLTLNEGEILCVVGESGSGKSTLGKIILRLEKPTDGQVLYKGKDIFKLGKQYTKEVSVVFQDPRTSLNPRMSVYEILKEPLVVHKEKDIEKKIKDALSRVKLPPEVLRRKPTQLSGGQAQRVAIARAIILSPRLVVADEPTASLDLSVQSEILALFSELNSKGIAFLFITHDIRVVEKIAHRVAVLYAGVLMELGEKEKVLRKPLHPYTQYLLSNVPARHPKDRKPVESIYEEEQKPPKEGCPFLPRCPKALEECTKTIRRVEIDGRTVSCNLY
ncbi:MAG: ABC transporter ATP-binding protein [Aquificae bacterium]|nr:ABC transporter ATP-binding protein [Aquificota bacterium]